MSTIIQIFLTGRGQPLTLDYLINEQGGEIFFIYYMKKKNCRGGKIFLYFHEKSISDAARLLESSSITTQTVTKRYLVVSSTYQGQLPTLYSRLLRTLTILL